MASRYWIATGAGTHNWNDTANWSSTSGGAGGESVPTSSDDVIFNGSGTGNCTINANVSANSWDIQSGYTGQVLNSGNYSYTIVGNFTWSGAGSTFQCGTNTHSVGGNMTLNAGSTPTWTGSTSTWQVSGDWSSTGLSTALANHFASMTLVLLGTSKTFNAWSTSNHRLLTVTIGDGTNTASRTIPLAAAFRGILCRTLTIKNNATLTNSETGSSGGVGAQAWTIESGGTYAGAGNTRLYQDSGAWSLSLSGTYSNTGSVIAAGPGTLSTIPTGTGTWTFNKYIPGNVAVTFTGTLCRFTAGVVFNNELTSGSYTITNNATTLQFDNTLIVQASGGGTGTIAWSNANTMKLAGSGTHTITLNNLNYGDLVVDATGTKNFASAKPFTVDDLTLTNGTVNFNGNTITVGGNFTASSGSTINPTGLAGATLDITGNASFAGTSGSHKTLNPSSSWTLDVGGSTATMTYCDVKNCLSTGIEIDASDGTNTDEGGNLNIDFGALEVTLVSTIALRKPLDPVLDIIHPLANGLIYDCPLWEMTGTIQNTSLPVRALRGTGNVTHHNSRVGHSVSTNVFSTSYSPTLNATGKITFACLVLFTGNQTTNGSPFRRGVSDAASNSLWGFEALSSTSIAAVVRNSGGTRLTTSNFAYSQNRWYHLLAVVDPAGTIDFWVDGQKIESKNIGSFSYASSTGGIVCLNGVSNVAFVGRLGGCWAWKRALGNDEIRSHARDPWQLYD